MRQAWRRRLGRSEYVVDLPVGTVTFLFTDLEGSTRRWEEHPEVMPGALARHDEILEQAITAHRGVVYSRMGDGMAAVFGSARDAVAAAVEAQQGLAREQWPLPLGTLAARMGIHTGEGILVDGHYLNQPLNRCARLMAVAQGGQLVISGTTEPLVRGELGDGVALVDLGEHRLRDLDRPMHVFQVGGGTFAQLRSMSAFPGNLPLQVTSFVGRITELAAIQEALAQSRLVTLTGVGGVGKSRLALQVAADLLPRHRDGAWLVELGSVRDGAQVADAMATAFGLTVPSGAHAVDALVDLLRNKLLLVVVDNCEHLIGAAAELVSTLISSCDSVTVLATSREGLAVSGERIIAVPSLGAPSPHDPPDTVAASAAVRLFIDRAVAVDAAFRLSGANSEAVAEVCRRLDGIPLAIELAAARIPTISPAELAGRLDRRFRVLAGGRRGAVERHQTLRAAIDWSFDLLSPAEQILLTRLSVFAGGCDLRACEEVCAGGVVEADDVLDLLAGLVARSLVVADHDGPVTRYRLLETIRQYGEERLDPTEAEGLRAAHATYYAELAEQAFRQAYGPEELLWRQRFAAEGENLVAAMNWAIDTDDADVGLQIGASILSRFQGGYTVAIPVEPALGLGGAADHRLYPQALDAGGVRSRNQRRRRSGRAALHPGPRSRTAPRRTIGRDARGLGERCPREPRVHLRRLQRRRRALAGSRRASLRRRAEGLRRPRAGVSCQPPHRHGRRPRRGRGRHPRLGPRPPVLRAGHDQPGPRLPGERPRRRGSRTRPCPDPGVRIRPGGGRPRCRGRGPPRRLAPHPSVHPLGHPGAALAGRPTPPAGHVQPLGPRPRRRSARGGRQAARSGPRHRPGLDGGVRRARTSRRPSP